MSNWYLENGKESDVVISTRVKIARNIDGINFVNKINEKDKEKVMNMISEIVPNLGYGLKLIKLEDLDEITKMSLVEKNLINSKFANKKGKGYGILINNEENICIMINQEDHISIQVFSEGLAVEETINLAIEIDEKLGKLLPFAYNEKYGFLTAYPTNVGTAMKVSTLVHLPALTQTQNILKILRIVAGFGTNIKNAYGDGIETRGSMYKIYNSQTLGISEEDIGKGIKTITEKIVEQERVARDYLGKTGIELENRLYRAYGLLAYSRLITLDECIELLSDVKLGTDMGIIKELDDAKVKKMWLYTKPANMQKYLGQTLGEREAQCKRAEVIHQIISQQ